MSFNSVAIESREELFPHHDATNSIEPTAFLPAYESGDIL